MLVESRSTDRQVQANIQSQLEICNQMPNFNSYLAFILTQMHGEGEEIRSVAGLLLKNNVKTFFDQLLQTNEIKFIQQTLLADIADGSKLIRSTICNCLATITRLGGLQCWLQNQVDVVQQLCVAIDSGNEAAMEGAMVAIANICEDCADQLENEQFGRPVNYLFPKLIPFFQHPHEQLRKNALAAIVHLLQASHHLDDQSAIAHAVRGNLQQFLQGIFGLANDQNLEIKKDVCRSFVVLLEYFDNIRPFISDIIKYMLHQTQDSNESLALEACEFWSVIAEMEIAISDLKPFIPQLLPILLKGMVYSEMDRSIFSLENDADRPDREDSIHPSLLNKKAKPSTHVAHDAGANDGDGDDEDEDDDDGDEEKQTEWNLRKCSASSLDVLSSMFGDELLEPLLPLIQARIQQQAWEVRESAILALGAVAEGCYTGMRQHLPVLLPHMVQTLHQDGNPLVRSITCWTVSRYAKWIVSEDSGRQLFEPVLQGLLARILDDNKKVQEAACSAFATFEEEAQADLAPYLGPILNFLVPAFDKYQAKNLFILYDAVVTLADAVQRRLNQPEFIQILMPPLVRKWQTLADDDRALFPLLACMTSVAQALGPGFLPYAEECFRRCIRLIENNFRQRELARSNPAIEAPDREFVVCSLDMLSGLADALESALEPLVAQSNLLVLLCECMKDEAADVRQSAYAFVGDLAKTCMPHLRQALPHFMPILVANLAPTPVSVCNNASWAIGEIAVKIGGDISNWVNEIVDRLIPIMKKHLNRNLLENTGITLGRLGLVCPEQVAPKIQEFIQPWCFNLRNIRNDVEKEHAFLGLCQMIRRNPGGVFEHFAYVCDAFASWGNPRDELKQEFAAILNHFQQQMGPQWGSYYAQFPDSLRQHLHNVYGLR